MIATRSNIRRRRAAGFTLVEALVAMVVIALVLPVVLQGISIAARVNADARMRGVAAQLAKGKLDELVATDGWKTGPLSGDFELDTPGFVWSAEAVGWGTGTLSQLQVTVTYQSAGRERAVTISTLVNPELY